MTNGQALYVSEGDIRAVAHKLDEFCDRLAPTEQIVMAWLLRRAAESEDISGYDATPPDDDQRWSAVANALGLSILR